MDKDKSQMDHHSSQHNNIPHENSVQQHVSSLAENEPLDQEAEMDALESRLFAMARSRC